MNVFVTLDLQGNVLGITRTLDGAAHLASAHADQPRVGDAPLSIDGLAAAMADTGRAEVEYGDGTPAIRIEHHAVTI